MTDDDYSPDDDGYAGVTEDPNADRDYPEDLLALDRPDPTDEPVPAGRLPDHFWFAREALSHIHAAALSWPVSPDGLLGATLARIAVAHRPEIQLPPRGSLNLLVALVGPSGAGKSETIAAAEALLPLDHRTDLVIDVPMGSGEGIADVYLGAPYKVDGHDGRKEYRRDQIVAGALFIVDEGQILAQISGRSGSTLFPTLRTAWSGGTLGQKNAAAERDRRIPAHRYRFAAILGIQPQHAAAILDDSAGGTPQRLLWFPVTDPRIAELDHLPAWPGVLDLPTPAHSTGERLTLHPDVAGELQRNRIAAAAGNRVADELDSHRDLLRLKVAALLALLDQRRDINPEDWHLAQLVMRTSSYTRAVLVEIQRAEAAKAQRNRIAYRVAEHEAVESSAHHTATVRGAVAIARKTHRAKPEELPLKHRDLTLATAGRDRQAASVDEMIAHAMTEKWIAVELDEERRPLYSPGRNRPA